MNLEKINAPLNAPTARIYIAAAILRNFRGKQNVEVQLFRPDVTPEEIETAKSLDLVGPPAPNMPAELIAGASEKDALACILEAFTETEADQLAEYLGKRYADQIESLTICPMDLPAPLGISPLSAIPSTASSGFINFDEAPDYSLPFRFKGYYDLGQMLNN